jgi:hypothetical protein
VDGLDQPVLVGSGGCYLVNNGAFSLEESSVHINRFRSLQTVTVGSGGHRLVNYKAFSSNVYFILCRPLSVFVDSCQVF